MAFVTNVWSGSKGEQYRDMRKRKKERKTEIGKVTKIIDEKGWRLETDEDFIR